MTVLDDIIVGVRADLSARMATLPYADLEARAAATPAPQDAAAALRRAPGAVSYTHLTLPTSDLV